MNRNKFKVLLCCYTMGIAGCNKIANTSHMDDGGDRKDEKKPESKDSFSVAKSSSNVVTLQGSSRGYDKMLEDSLSDMKRTADLAEEIAMSKQEAANNAIKAADDAKKAAESTRKTADDREKARLELRGVGTSYNKMLEDSLSDMKRTADLAEEIAMSKQEAADNAIKAADDAKKVAESTRKTADDREKARLELRRSNIGGGDTL